MAVWDVQSVFFNAVNAHVGILANVRCFPPELAVMLKCELLFQIS